MISVVIPTCRRPDLLARCLARLAPDVQTLPADQYEVIVTDDGDPTVEGFLAENFPSVRWTSGPRRGPAANRNAGALRARGDWLAFTDDDCIPDSRWLEKFSTAIDSRRKVYEGKTTCVAGLHSPFDHSPVNLTGGCLWSCNIFIHRETFEQFGGFDENFPFPYMEDADFRDRLVHAGYSFEFGPDAIVDHPPRRPASGLQLARQHESWVYYWYKCGYRTLASPRLVCLIVEARLKAIRRHRLSADSLLAIGSLGNELAGMIPRLLLWEWKYRYRFRSPLPH
jgi:GT2 family glycosyltransferase